MRSREMTKPAKHGKEEAPPGPPMELRPADRALVSLALALLLLGGLAGVWELFALQAPYTPLRAPQLPAPVAQLRGFAFTLGLLLLGVTWLRPHWAPEGAPRRWLVTLFAGTAASVGALAYGAFTSSLVTQIVDPRPDSSPLFALRAVGHLLL